MYYLMSGDRLLASVRRTGNGSAAAPVRWMLEWGLSVPPPNGQVVDWYADRHEAIAAVLRIFPHARVEEFNRRGERVR